MRIDSADPRQNISDRDDEQNPEPKPEPHVSRITADSIDTSLRLYAQNAVPQPRNVVDASGGSSPAFNDRIMYVGMNTYGKQCDKESHSLNAVVIGHSERDKDLGADKVRVGTRVVDLSTDAGAEEFAKSLALPAAQTAAIATVLRHASAGSRDELAGIANVWARGERGASIPSRIVLSGHCAGDAIYDGGSENLGALRFSSVQALAAAMPKASAQIEDLMISACSSGFDGASATAARVPLSSWKSAFPNLKTAWGYGSPKDVHSPSEQQAVMHIAAWERSTRGRAQPSDGKATVDSFFKAVETAGKNANPAFKLDAPQADGNVSVWSVSHGYRGGKG